MSGRWFQELIRAEVDKRDKNDRGGTVQLAKELGVDESVVRKWLRGASPSLENAELVLTKTGGDIKRAHPKWQPYPEASAAVRQENVELRAEVDDLKKRLRIIQAVTIEPIGIPRHRNSRGYSAPDETLRFVLNEPSKDDPKKE